MSRRQNNKLVFVDNDIVDDDEMLPPHKIIARGSGASPKTTFSMLEGVKRTLKGGIFARQQHVRCVSSVRRGARSLC
ncbi:protein S40-7-like [Prosopis cineraria]|uniref:protein S40-7-like n=1 Tax=Prosopis cineraria TaxID=364024 RepID=UPI00240FA489|nr:protein S40-7-like [Prosopis cineraria]